MRRLRHSKHLESGPCLLLIFYSNSHKVYTNAARPECIAAHSRAHHRNSDSSFFKCGSFIATLSSVELKSEDEKRNVIRLAFLSPL